MTSLPLHVMAVPDSAQAKFCDSLDIDQDAHLLYAGDNWSGGVDVFDIAGPEPKYLRTIGVRGRMFGLAVAPNLGKLFVGVSGSTVAAIELSSGGRSPGSEVVQIDTGGENHVDLIEYDPARARIYAANRFDRFLTVIDATTNQIVGRVSGLGRGLEQPRLNPSDGMVYLTDNKDNCLFQIDPEAGKLLRTFEIADPCYPNGLAINPKTNQALLGCSNRENPHTVFWDLTKQEIGTVVGGCGCGDGAIYDPTVDRFFFAAAGFNRGPVISIFAGDPVQLLSNVPSAQGAGWVGYDRTNNRVYAPAIVDAKPALLNFALSINQPR